MASTAKAIDGPSLRAGEESPATNDGIVGFAAVRVGMVEFCGADFSVQLQAPLTTVVMYLSLGAWEGFTGYRVL